uniref:F-box domain-containing protein n=1 Tax=Mycena chlorophos TaxID=658473 RepID=A0ABQ0LVT3_MYCCL|nr:predicted protein [Mycena chlorophos]
MAATESPFNDILHTNAVPTNEQCDDIRTYLNPIREKLAQADAEIVRLRELLGTAIEKRDALQMVVSAHDALVSPMRRIPDDVLGAIFLETLPERRNTALHATEGPLLLVQVCRYWRDLAYSLPRLWASMHVVVGDAADDVEAVGCVLSEIPSWLKRSGAVPLAVTIVPFRRVPARLPEITTTRTVLKILLPEVKRWRDIQLTLLGMENLNALGLHTLTADDVPQLVKFDLNFSGRPPIPQQPLFNFLSTPTLRKLSFVGHYNMLSASIAWQNLQAIHIHFAASDTSIRIPFPYPFLSRCTSAEKLSLSISGNLVYSTGDLHPVQLPLVTILHLSLYDHGETKVGRLLHNLEMPALHTLCIWDIQSVQPRSLFESPNYAGIKCLVFPASNIASTELYAILAMLPLLERLRLLGEPTIPVLPSEVHQNKTDGEFLSRFVLDAASTAHSPLCPSLQHLELIGWRHTSHELILRLLRSRTPPTNNSPHTMHIVVKPLTAFNAFIFRDRLTHTLAHQNKLDLEKELSENIACGLKLKLCYQGPVNVVVYSRLRGTERDPTSTQARFTQPEHEWLQDFAPASFL